MVWGGLSNNRGLTESTAASNMTGSADEDSDRNLGKFINVATLEQPEHDWQQAPWQFWSRLFI